jgi:hypothetical protein
MPAYYVKTGALLKRYKSEPGSDVLRELFDRRHPGALAKLRSAQ